MMTNKNTKTNSQQTQVKLTSFDNNITIMHKNIKINSSHFQSTVKQNHHYVIISITISLLHLLSMISFVAPTTATVTTRTGIVQPKTSLGYKCVRRNHQLFCPKPPTNIHGQTRSSTLYQRANGALESEQKSVNYSSTTITNQLSSTGTKSDSNNDRHQLPCSKCDRSSTNKYMKSTSQQHSPSFYAFLPHETSATGHLNDPHEHLIVDVHHSKLHQEYNTLHEATVVHRVKRDDIHEFIEENKALMKRMFGNEAPQPIEDDFVLNRNTLYPMSNYAYAIDLDDHQVAGSVKTTDASQHDHTNNHYEDNYSGQHNKKSKSNNNDYLASNETETRSLLSTGQLARKRKEPLRKRIVTSASEMASQGTSNGTNLSASQQQMHSKHRRKFILDADNGASQNQQHKQLTTSEISTKAKNATEVAATIEDHDVVTSGTGQVRSKRSSRTNGGAISNNVKDLFAHRVDSCESHLEVVTPYWATNSHGHVRAIVNSQHMQQAIQQEICKCNGECSCEQKYKWHRMLAYDPEENCKGIFMDWFLFPSNCVCRCIVKSPAALIGQPTSTPLPSRADALLD